MEVSSFPGWDEPFQPVLRPCLPQTAPKHCASHRSASELRSFLKFPLLPVFLSSSKLLRAARVCAACGDQACRRDRAKGDPDLLAQPCPSAQHCKVAAPTNSSSLPSLDSSMHGISQCSDLAMPLPTSSRALKRLFSRRPPACPFS